MVGPIIIVMCRPSIFPKNRNFDKIAISGGKEVELMCKFEILISFGTERLRANFQFPLIGIFE